MEHDFWDEEVNKTFGTTGIYVIYPRSHHNHRRGVFVYPLYSNYIEFLTDTIGEDVLDRNEPDWIDWWLRKSNSRLEKLEREDRVLNEPLFHEEISPDELAMWVSVRGVSTQIPIV